KFDQAGTYYFCRASGGFTRDHTMLPYTIFTFVNRDSLKKGVDTRPYNCSA
ncbi:hypothetical protein BCR41DRAFT_306076, partial [Lobosporangium transversale]